MSWRIGILIALVSAVCLTVESQVSPLGNPVQMLPTQQLPSPTLDCLPAKKQARLITVKVLSDQLLGSGVLIHREDQTYQVITNAHVLQAGKAPYFIQTPNDGKIHPATPIATTTKLQGNDLALLQFEAPNLNYSVAKLAEKPIVRELVIAAGFPLENNTAEFKNQGNFVIKRGQIEWVLKKPLEGGYKIGYTNDIQKGMSGGPLLNCTGEVVSINGIHADPVWGDPYVFQDGSYPVNADRERMSQYSWGIPIQTVVQLFPQLLMVQKPSKI